MPGLLIDTLRGTRGEQVPLWLMRQAGRYLPEYRALRKEKGGFLDLVYDSEAACEVTLQPIRRFGFDGAILFSDILIVPHALGQNLEFLAGEGPKLSPKLVDHALESLQGVSERFDPIYRTVGLVSAALGPETGNTATMLGFAGSPWTVATYMVAGEGSRDQHQTREMAYRDPAALGAIIAAIVESSVGYLSGQIEAGAEAVQLFDSWAGSLAPDQFERWVIAPNARIVSALKDRHPGTPIIGFPKGSGEKLPAFCPAPSDLARSVIERSAAAIERLARLTPVEFSEAPEGAAMQVVAGDDVFIVPLAGVIDIDAERARLQKALEASQKEAKSLEGRLGNANFVDRAKPEAVEKAREDLAHHTGEMARLNDALTRLG